MRESKLRIDFPRTLAHDLVDLAILLAANKLLVFIGQLDLDVYLTRILGQPLHPGDDVECGLHRIIRPRNVECEFIEGDVSV